MADPLAKLIGRTPTEPSHLRAMSAAAWHKQGFIAFRPEDVRNELDRLHAIQIAEKLYGKRAEQPP